MFHHLWHKNFQFVLAMKLLLSVMAARAIITLKKVMASCIKLLHASINGLGNLELMSFRCTDLLLKVHCLVKQMSKLLCRSGEVFSNPL